MVLDTTDQRHREPTKSHQRCRSDEGELKQTDFLSVPADSVTKSSSDTELHKNCVKSKHKKAETEGGLQRLFKKILSKKNESETEPKDQKVHI